MTEDSIRSRHEDLEDIDEVQRAVDETIGALDLRDEVLVGEPMTVGEFAEMFAEMKEAHDGR